jgi:ribbon-helix-helix CopG family protein
MPNHNPSLPAEAPFRNTPSSVLVYLPSDDAYALRLLARREHTAQAEVLRRALRAYLRHIADKIEGEL